MSDEKRLEELRAKEVLTDEEMSSLIRSSPPGSFKSGPNLHTMGVIDVKKAFDNLNDGAERSRHALDKGCYLEAISLRLQHIEFWLRMFWVVRNAKGQIFGTDDKRTFGRIIKDCEDLGFRPDLITQMREFNAHRVNAIHKYLLGATDYSELREVCDGSTGLDMEVGKYVRQEVGIVIS